MAAAPQPGQSQSPSQQRPVISGTSTSLTQSGQQAQPGQPSGGQEVQQIKQELDQVKQTLQQVAQQMQQMMQQMMTQHQQQGQPGQQPGGQPSHPIAPGGGAPTHPIYNPPQPTHPIYNPPPQGGGRPPQGGAPGQPTHPIAPGGPPPSVWPGPGYPAHPIAPGGGGPVDPGYGLPGPGGGQPSHPIAPGGPGGGAGSGQQETVIQLINQSIMLEQQALQILGGSAYPQPYGGKR